MKKIHNKEGRIVTFYSYKGGVGRSMALANISVVLANWGYKVLLIDWDLEAPGLENFFKEFLSIDEVRAKPGIINLLQSRKADNDEALLQWQKCIIPINCRSKKQSIDIDDKLHIITSGKIDDNYYDIVRSFDITSFYNEDHGGTIIENLRNEWKKDYDFVFIDSRTGITDIGGVCTIQLPDILVLLFTPTMQGFEGIKRVIKKAKQGQHDIPFDRLDLLALPIPTRMDNSETIIHTEWVERFAEGLVDAYADWLPERIDREDFLLNTKIPYIPLYSFGEGLPFFEEGAKDTARMGYVYEGIAALIADNLNNPELLLNNRSRLLSQAIEPIVNKNISNKEIADVLPSIHEIKKAEIDLKIREEDVLNKEIEFQKKQGSANERRNYFIGLMILLIIGSILAIFFFNNRLSKPDQTKYEKLVDSIKLKLQDSLKNDSLWKAPDTLISPLFVKIRNMGKPVGIDIYHKDNITDWQQLKQCGITFIFIKATEGYSIHDTSFLKNWTKAQQYGLIRGAYHYFSETISSQAQASNFINNVKLTKGDLPPVLDLQALYLSDYPSNNIPEKLLKNIKNILDIFEINYNVKPIIYARYNIARVLFKDTRFTSYTLWVAAFNNKHPDSPKMPLGWSNLAFWQFSDSENLPGVENQDSTQAGIDLNQFNGTTAELRALTIK